MTVDGRKVSIAYDSPGGDGNVIQIDATLDNGALAGTWKIVDSAKAVMQSGTFTSTKN